MHAVMRIMPHRFGICFYSPHRVQNVLQKREPNTDLYNSNTTCTCSYHRQLFIGINIVLSGQCTEELWGDLLLIVMHNLDTCGGAGCARENDVSNARSAQPCAITAEFIAIRLHKNLEENIWIAEKNIWIVEKNIWIVEKNIWISDKNISNTDIF